VRDVTVHPPAAHEQFAQCNQMQPKYSVAAK
jgi:hypothetical protein